MSHLVQIEGSNFKGAVTFAKELAPLTVVTGTNFSGKSRILDAVRVLLLGYHPKLGKQNSNTFELASGVSMNLAGQFADKTIVQRGFSMQKGSVKRSGDDKALVPAMLLDANEYFSLSGQDRIRHVIENANTDELGVTDDSVRSDIRNALTKGLKESTPANEKERQKLDAIIDELVEDRQREEATMPQFIQVLMDNLTENLKSATATVKRLTGSVQTSSVLRATEMPTNQNVESELIAARKQRDELVKQRAELESAAGLKAWKDRKQQFEKLTAELNSRPDRTKEIKATEKAIKKLEKSAMVDVSEKLKANMQRLATVSKEGNGCVADIASATQQTKRCQQSISEQMIRTCPCCGESGATCKATSRMVRETETLLADLEVRRAASEKKRHELAVEEESLIDATENLQIEQNLAQRAREELNHLKTIDLVGHQNAQKWHDESVKRLDDFGPLGPEPDTAAADAVTKEMESVENQIGILEAGQNRLTAWRQDQFRQEQAKQEQALALAEVEILKLAKDAVTVIQDKLVTEAFNGLLLKARRFTDDILLSPLAYHDGDMGRWNGSTFIRHRTFTGTEEKLAYAGLSVALASDAKHKIVMFDEWLLDDGNRVKFIDRLKKLIEERYIDQALLVDIDPAPYRKLLGDGDLLLEVKP